jgi:hypothetical protein
MPKMVGTATKLKQLIFTFAKVAMPTIQSTPTSSAAFLVHAKVTKSPETRLIAAAAP